MGAAAKTAVVVVVAAALLVVLTSGAVLGFFANDEDDDAVATGAAAGQCLVSGLPAVASEVDDLTPVQVRNATAIVQTGLELGVPTKGLVVSLATALQEAGLKNLASSANPGSLRFPHDGVAPGDFDSVGLFQQRDSWGSLQTRMTPAESARMFFTGGDGGQRGLLDVPGWEGMEVWEAAQATQVSAFPMAYAKWVGTATAAVAAITGGATVTCAQPVIQAGDGSVVSAVPPGSYRIGSPFGWRIHPITHKRKHHNGQDFPAPTGTPVSSIAAGTVSFAAMEGSYGNVIFVDHDGFQSRYAHLSRIGVRAGQQVQAGQVIGAVGSTGGSTGAHLHLEVRIGGQPTDPMQWACARGIDYGAAASSKEPACV